MHRKLSCTLHTRIQYKERSRRRLSPSVSLSRLLSYSRAAGSGLYIAKIPSKGEERSSPKHNRFPGSTKTSTNYNPWSRAVVCSPNLSCVWSPTPDTHCETSFSIECGGEEADDEDNIAYGKLLASFKSDHGPSPQVPGVVASDDDGLSNGTFTHSVAHAGKEVSVKALRHGDHLFVYLSSRATELSKECLVSLLEYAEVELHCRFAYIFFDCSTPEVCRKQILRNFHFLGFELLRPDHPMLPVRSDEYVFMGYEIDPGGDSDSETEEG